MAKHLYCVQMCKMEELKKVFKLICKENMQQDPKFNLTINSLHVGLHVLVATNKCVTPRCTALCMHWAMHRPPVENLLHWTMHAPAAG